MYENGPCQSMVQIPTNVGQGKYLRGDHFEAGGTFMVHENALRFLNLSK